MIVVLGVILMGGMLLIFVPDFVELPQFLEVGIPITVFVSFCLVAFRESRLTANART